MAELGDGRFIEPKATSSRRAREGRQTLFHRNAVAQGRVGDSFYFDTDHGLTLARSHAIGANRPRVVNIATKTARGLTLAAKFDRLDATRATRAAWHEPHGLEATIAYEGDARGLHVRHEGGFVGVALDVVKAEIVLIQLAVFCRGHYTRPVAYMKSAKAHARNVRRPGIRRPPAWARAP